MSQVFASPPMSGHMNPTIQTRSNGNAHALHDFPDSTSGQTHSQTSLHQNIPVTSSRTDAVSCTPEEKDARGIGSFLDVEEPDVDSSRRDSDEIPILQRSDDATPDQHMKASGSTFDELVDRLLSQPMSKADTNYTEVFLCLYRKFAAPGKLLSAILARLEKTSDDKTQHFLTRTTAQLRIIAVLTKWISNYPGDFASSQTTQKFNAFLEQIAIEPAFNYAAQEMKSMLRSHVTEDDDTRWERTDIDAEIDEIDDSAVASSSTQSMTDVSKTTDHSLPTEERSGRRGRRHSETVSVSSVEAASMISGRPSGLHTVGDYEIEAATLIPSKRHPLTKILYHNFMVISDDDFADEITRIDWVMFSSVRVRDLIRDVSLSPQQKAKCKSLINVSRAINHFNHVACWVTNMILLRDKAKHRAQILEKFMRIAWKLRQMNNYCGLAAVMAGIQNTSVGRLAQMQALISEGCRKQFMGLEILMGPRRSHFAYRLAWQNSTLPRIPYIPLCRRDLATAEEGSKTFVGPKGDRINWSKFEVFGEVILPIMKSHTTPVNLEKHDIARELILDCWISTDEEVSLAYCLNRTSCL